MAELNCTNLLYDSSLRAYYRFESGALTTDKTTNGYTLTNNNSVASTTGQFSGGATTGSGNTNKNFTISSDFGINGNASMSISLWFKLDAEISTGLQMFYRFNTTNGANRYFQIYYQYNGGTRRLLLDNAGNSTTHNVTLGTTWHHLVVTRTTTTACGIYLDGASVGGTAAQGSSTGGSVTTAIFSEPVGNYMSAIFDDLAIFNKVLSSTEVTKLYSGACDNNANFLTFMR